MPTPLRPVPDDIPAAIARPKPVTITVDGDIPLADVFAPLVSAGYRVTWDEVGIAVSKREDRE